MKNPVKQTTEIEAYDIATLREMSSAEYEDYVESHLIITDARGFVRATQGAYPLACTREQLEILIRNLQGKMDLLEP